MAKLWDGVYQGEGIIKALKPTLELGMEIEVFIPDELIEDYKFYQSIGKIIIKEVENPKA